MKKAINGLTERHGPQFQVGELVKGEFQYASLEPFTAMGVVTEVEGKTYQMYYPEGDDDGKRTLYRYDVLWGDNGEVETMTEGQLTKL